MLARRASQKQPDPIGPDAGFDAEERILHEERAEYDIAEWSDDNDSGFIESDSGSHEEEILGEEREEYDIGERCGENDEEPD